MESLKSGPGAARPEELLCTSYASNLWNDKTGPEQPMPYKRIVWKDNKKAVIITTGLKI